MSRMSASYIMKMDDRVHLDTQAMSVRNWIVFHAAFCSVYFRGSEHEQDFAIDHGIIFG